MKRMDRCVWLAVAIVCLAQSLAMAAKWVEVGEFQAGGDGKSVAFNGKVSACRIVCTEGSVIVNTFIVIEGNKKTPISVGVRIPAGQSHEIALPGGPRAVTGFRISDNARGKYRLDVFKMGTGGKGRKGDRESDDESEPSPPPVPTEPKPLPLPAGLPPPVEAGPPPVKSETPPTKEPVVPATEPAAPAIPPVEPAGGTTPGGDAPLPWEVK